MTIIWIAWMNAAPIGCSVLPRPGHANPTIGARMGPANICNDREAFRRTGVLPGTMAMVSSRLGIIGSA
jgi:hypothetical protein